ncbi:MAG: hypothetical protein ACLUEK_08470 [Oscillospiraceae bacterium]
MKKAVNDSTPHVTVRRRNHGRGRHHGVRRNSGCGRNLPGQNQRLMRRHSTSLQGDGHAW